MIEIKRGWSARFDELPRNETARLWRDNELKSTDWVVTIADHPQHADYIAYRQALRDWPDSISFPETKPVL